MVEMEAEQQMIDTSKTECGETLIKVQIEPASRATAKMPVINPTVEFWGVSTRRANAPLKSPVNEIEHTLHRGRRANKSKVAHLEPVTSISMLSLQAESAEGTARSWIDTHRTVCMYVDFFWNARARAATLQWRYSGVTVALHNFK